MRSPSIGICMIVKNEEVMLRKCLESVQDANEIYIADTGSQDRTVELAKLFTPHVYTDYKWEDSFCKARNYIKSKAKTDWLLSLDADEILHDWQAVREAVAIAEQRHAKAVDVTMIAADFSQQEFRYPRLFKNIPEVYWLGNIHNHLSVLGEGLSKIRITHGYSPAHQLDPDRAFRILKKDVENNPDSARELFYLGREYFYKNDFENTIKMLSKYVQVSEYLPEKAEAFLIMAKAYWKNRRPNDARDACVQAIICNANFKEALILMTVLAGKGTNQPTWEANAAAWEVMANHADNRDVLFVRKAPYDFR